MARSVKSILMVFGRVVGHSAVAYKVNKSFSLPSLSLLWT